MKALQLIAHGQPGQFRHGDVPDPSPAPDEVVVEVKACGLNHLDLWLEAGTLPIPLILPRIPGSEVAGVVSATGSDVQGWQLGDRVAVQSNLFCGQCEFCQRGEESLCLKSQLLGIQCDGGFAGRMTVAAAALVKLPANLDFSTAAALTLAGSTAMHMLTDRAQVRRGDWVLVMGGASGVGSAAIQIARELGGRVISTGRTAAKRDFALQRGAEFVVDPTTPDWPAEVRRLTGKRGVDLVIEHVGGDVLNQIFQCLARNGAIVTCGATAGRDIHFNLWPFFVKQQRLIGSYGRNRKDLEQTFAWAAAGRLKAGVEASMPLAEAPQAFVKLRRGDVLGKLLIVP